MSGSRAVGEGWQATGCGSAPPDVSWCPPGFLSLPPGPELERMDPEKLETEPGVAGLDKAGWPGTAGVSDWEGKSVCLFILF